MIQPSGWVGPVAIVWSLVVFQSVLTVEIGQQIQPEHYRAVAAAIRISTAEVEDVVSFYTMFYQRPVGKHVIQVCRTLSCALNGAERVTEELQKVLGISAGETTADGAFSLFEVECLGACDRAPVVGVNDDWHECQRPEDAQKLVDGLRTTGAASLTGCHLHKEHP